MTAITMDEAAVDAREGLVEKVANYLREHIVMDHFQPGQRLPERKLAEELDVSRTPMREALKLAYHFVELSFAFYEHDMRVEHGEVVMLMDADDYHRDDVPMLSEREMVALMSARTSPGSISRVMTMVRLRSASMSPAKRERGIVPFRSARTPAER